MARAIDANRMKEELLWGNVFFSAKEINALVDLIDNQPTLPQPSNEALAGWVSIDERLPEKRQDVLVHYGNGRIGIDWIDSTQCFVFDELYGRVTHWLPIPELPDRRQPEGEEDT